MDDIKKFSLSHYFDELGSREKKKKETKAGIGGQISGARQISSFSANMAVIKSLMAADNHTLPFMALAKASKLKLDSCKEIIEELQDEGFVGIEPDEQTGNDRITLTSKGEGLFP